MKTRQNYKTNVKEGNSGPEECENRIRKMEEGKGGGERGSKGKNVAKEKERTNITAPVTIRQKHAEEINTKLKAC